MSKVFIIAEAGVNHNGSIEIAKKLVDIALDSGADGVKFQSFKSENIVTKVAERASYQKENQGGELTQYEMLKKLELSIENHKELKVYCDKVGIKFLSSPFDLESIELLKNLNLEIYKIPSSEIENLPYLRKIGSLNKKIILSTGMSNLGDVEFAMEVLILAGAKDITLLHCTSNYPTAMENVNLMAMKTLEEKFNVDIGYSDHTNGSEVAIAAVALGAKVIEKHFTLSKEMDGPDHKASIEPHELKELVSKIRNIEKALGNNTKIPTESERIVSTYARKSLVSLKDIKIGEYFTSENLGVKRPGTGVSPKQWDIYLGSKAKKNYKPDELIDE
ncbi:N-acetylneuraminate synthase [Clostridium gasigenes]|uniref:N-acetylneuraminate synthase n=1 Tax=Clostridium gasigenes TaxID=94869 RepID=UPI001626FCFE|nr:N-acetylneuraminate synthase [Clostridium gasigenes]MBB6623579.1 N-acetylneuraminate synthase [Clostridium gasigenes]